MASIILNDEGSDAFSLRLIAGRLVDVYFHQFYSILEVLGSAIRQEKGIKGAQSRKEEAKMFLFTGGMIIYIEKPKDSTEKL